MRVPICGQVLQQPYIVKQWQDVPSHLQSDGAGLLPLHVIHHVSDEKQGLHLGVSPGNVQALNDAWQQHGKFSCLEEGQSFHLVKR